MIPAPRCMRLLLVAASCLLGGCASFTYEAEEWRVAVPPEGNGSPHAIVRYIGLSAPTKNAADRAKLVASIHAMAEKESPGSSFAPLLHNAQRKVYLEGSKIVLEESGSVRDPFSWFEQTGLNPLCWFAGSLNLSQKGNFVVKRDLDDNQLVLATDGRVVDETTYTTILKGLLPLDLTCNTRWQRPVDMPNDEDVRDQHLSVLMWPRAARTFYWRLSGRAFGKRDQSLAAEYEKAHPDTPRQKAPLEDQASPSPSPPKAPASKAKQASPSPPKAPASEANQASPSASPPKAPASEASEAASPEFDDDSSTIK